MGATDDTVEEALHSSTALQFYAKTGS